MTYACHNRSFFEKSLQVQDGWLNTWARRMVDMEFRMDPSCVYSTSDLGQKDKGCEGCKWRKTDVEMASDAGRVEESGDAAASSSSGDAGDE